MRPVRTVNLIIMQPAQANLDAQRVSKSPLEFTLNTITPIQVDLRDDQNNGLWLRDITGGLESVPTLTITSGGSPVKLDAGLIETAQAGVYALNTDKLGMGQFQI